MSSAYDSDGNVIACVDFNLPGIIMELGFIIQYAVQYVCPAILLNVNVVYAVMDSCSLYIILKATH